MRTIELGTDVALGVTIPSRNARGRVARIGPVLDEVLANHNYPPVIEILLAEALVLTALLGTLLKDPSGQMTLQAQTENGIVDLLVCDYLGGAETKYNSIIGTRYLISAVARGLKPGCKVDTMPMNVYSGRGSKREFSMALLGWIRDHLDVIEPGPRRTLIADIIARFDAIRPALAALPAQAIHNDLNDYNILIRRPNLIERTHHQKSDKK